ncbi:MAG: acyloxyacyl hydrolase [Saprospiraceae bacterium]
MAHASLSKVMRVFFYYGAATGQPLTRVADPKQIPFSLPCWAILALLFFSRFAQAQPGTAIAFEATTYHGILWRHTHKTTIQTGHPVWGQEIGIRLQTQGKKSWHAWQRYPSFGVSLAHFRLGDRSHSTTWGLLPHLNVPVWRSGRFLATFRVGTGLGYVTRPYDSFSNPGQNAIGSHWNNFTQFRLGCEYRLSEHWRVQAGGALSHFSNGASTLPNFGVNLPGGFAALVWSPDGIREVDFFPASESKQGGKRWGGTVTGSLALVEYSIFDGPRYPVWGLSVAGYFQPNRINRVSLGLEYEFNRAVYEFGLRSTAFKNKDEAHAGATRLAVSVADEFLFGDLGVQVLAGIYAGGGGLNRVVPKPWYSKLSVRYYLPRLFGTALRWHVGISLKAHGTTAELISTNAGLAF